MSGRTQAASLSRQQTADSGRSINQSTERPSSWPAGNPRAPSGRHVPRAVPNTAPAATLSKNDPGIANVCLNTYSVENATSLRKQRVSTERLGLAECVMKAETALRTSASAAGCSHHRTQTSALSTPTELWEQTRRRPRHLCTNEGGRRGGGGGGGGGDEWRRWGEPERFRRATVGNRTYTSVART